MGQGGTACGKPFTSLVSPSHSHPGCDAPFIDEETEAPRGSMHPSGSQAPGSPRASVPHTGGLHHELHQVNVIISPILQERELRLREVETLAQGSRARVPTGVYLTSKPLPLARTTHSPKTQVS